MAGTGMTIGKTEQLSSYFLFPTGLDAVKDDLGPSIQSNPSSYLHFNHNHKIVLYRNEMPSPLTLGDFDLVCPKFV